MNNELEADLEELFRQRVRGTLRGRILKLVTQKGAPDRLVLLPQGRMYLVELKTSVGDTSPAQKLWHSRAKDLGTIVHLLYGRAEIEDWVRARHAELHN